LAEFTTYLPGTPSWIDLATTDLAAATDFYGQLLGWTAAETTSPDGTAYTMFSLRGLPVAGAYQLGAELVRNGIPPHWASYVTVTAADEAAARATAAGGTVVQGPYDVGDAGRMAVIQDPTAAMLAVWEPRSHFGAGLANETGSLVWNELQTYDTAAAASFYAAVFGWRAVAGKVATGEYTSFMLGDHPVAGMIAIRPEWGTVPPNWSVYLGVDDVVGACGLVAGLGGTIDVEPTEIPNVGMFALVRDPQGTYFYVMR
jgi:predicted enzyme related to lactoylglutathione lyase